MKHSWLRVAVAASLLVPSLALAGAPAFYVRKGTWQQTLLASREALLKTEQARLATAKEPVNRDAKGFRPTVVRNQTARSREGRAIKVRVRGLQVLWLGHTSPQKGRDAKLAGCWGDAVLVGSDGKKTPLHTLKPLVTRGDVDVKAPAPAASGKKRGRPKGIRLGRTTVTTGLIVKPDGELCYRLDGRYEMFTATVGVVSAANKKSIVEFHVSGVSLRETRQREADRARLWTLVQRDFSGPQAVTQMGREESCRIWEQDWTPGDRRSLANRYAGLLRSSHLAKTASDLARVAKTDADVQKLAAFYHQWQDTADNLALAKQVDLKALRRAIEDLSATFGDQYPNGAAYLQRLAALEKLDLAAVAKGKASEAAKVATDLVTLQRDALLGNPLLDFDKLLLVKRSTRSPKLGLPQNWQGNCSLPRGGYDNEIAVLSPVRPGGKITTLHRPEGDRFVGDVDLQFDGRRILFSSMDKDKRWQVSEMKVDGAGLRQVTQGTIAEVDNYDPCYLPDGRIIFASSAVMAGVPCVGGKNPVSNLYIMDANGSHIRQLCFDQDHNWCPAVMNDGRVMFTRWEYTDTAHYFTRLLFRMNPDGTQQMELYGSNSYWPNSIFYGRPVPGHPSKVIAVISGHHGVPRMGELVLFDTRASRHEADGVVQRIPGYGKAVEPAIVDRLVSRSWPKFLHPWPLSEKYFLVSCQRDSRSPWAICLVDVFDNIVPILALDGYAAFEPVPLKARPAPPVIPDKVKPGRKDSVVYLTDVYRGGGLDGVPRGTVKRLRVFEWHYGYQRVGGHQSATQEGGWEIKRLLGTVPVSPDGSASFIAPANTPLAVQPLDERGRALQLMRSWYTAMPGETVGCVGCHEAQHTGAVNASTRAYTLKPDAIQPWHGPTRGFSFPREVQPVLDAHCVKCHDGKPRKDGKTLPNLADSSRGWSGYTKSYLALHPYVRRPGPESDYHMLHPGEYLANTSELIQMLEKGHHGVQLDDEGWDRLATWIDLNVPDHGTWTEQAGEARCKDQWRLRMKYRKAFANVDVDPEAIVHGTPYKPKATARKPQPAATPAQPPAFAGWPFAEAEAKKRQAAAGPNTTRTIDLGDGVQLRLVLIPAGEFVMGGASLANADERPTSRVRISKPFWMATTETSNRQYRVFDPLHNSRFIDQHWKDHTTPGYPANLPQQPVIRISWQEAIAFCRWLAEKTGEPFTLPTEAQWEYACRAGSATAFSYGGLDADFAKMGNMGDVSLKRMAVKGVNPKPIKNPSANDAYLPMETRFDDGQVIVCDVGKYRPNAWGLQDMHGNVAEWTLSAYKPYPYRDGDGRNDVSDGSVPRVVRGGSWRDRPKRSRSAFRLAYPGWQGVFNVGFRVACPVGAGKGSVAAAR